MLTLHEPPQPAFEIRNAGEPTDDALTALAALLLALLATESLHGESQMRLEASHAMDAESRTCVVDAGSSVGRDLNRLFVGFVRREFGEDAFRVARIDRVPNPQQKQETST